MTFKQQVETRRLTLLHFINLQPDGHVYLFILPLWAWAAPFWWSGPGYTDLTERWAFYYYYLTNMAGCVKCHLHSFHSIKVKQRLTSRTDIVAGLFITYNGFSSLALSSVLFFFSFHSLLFTLQHSFQCCLRHPHYCKSLTCAQSR